MCSDSTYVGVDFCKKLCGVSVIRRLTHLTWKSPFLALNPNNLHICFFYFFQFLAPVGKVWKMPSEPVVRVWKLGKFWFTEKEEMMESRWKFRGLGAVFSGDLGAFLGFFGGSFGCSLKRFGRFLGKSLDFYSFWEYWWVFQYHGSFKGCLKLFWGLFRDFFVVFFCSGFGEF